MVTPWSRKRRLRIFGPSDLAMNVHISDPILLQKSFRESQDEDHDFTARPKMSPDVSPIDRSKSSRTCLQHLNFAKDSSIPQPYSIAQPSRAVSSQPAVQNRTNYSIYPTPASAMVRTSISTTMSQGTELPIQPLPPFSQARERGFSGQSSATVQIGLRLSYLHRALDPVEREPTSPSLHLPLQLTSSSRPSSEGSIALSTQPLDHYSVSTNRNLPIPLQPRKAQISERASMSRLGRQSSTWPIGETATDESASDDNLVGTTKPLPPVPLTVRTTDSQLRAQDYSPGIQSRPF